MSDAFSAQADAVSAPATRGVAVVPHDGTALTDIPKALFVGGAGDLVVRGCGGGGDVTLRGVAAGSVIPFRPSHVRATGTTATHIVALY